MYIKYFGFQRAPFDLVPDPDFLFLGESHDSALANLVSGLWSGKGFVAITGPIGAGKTTVLRALLRRLRRTDRICFLSQPEMVVEDLLRAILDGFGRRPAPDATIVELRRAIREFLEAENEAGVLIVDEAHLLSEEAMEQLRLLSNLEEDNRKLLQIVLSGQPELKHLLARPRLHPLAQRIEMFYDICPLSRDETAAYIERRLRIAGGPEAVVFEPSAIDVIHRCADGVPRLINLLADRALVAGYVADTGRITPELVREAYEDLGEVTQAVMPGSPAAARRRHRATGGAATRRDDAPAVDGATRRASVVPLPRRSRPAEAPGAVSDRTRRWTAGTGLLAVIALALLSLGNRVLGAPPTDAATLVGADRPTATVRPETPLITVEEDHESGGAATSAVPSVDGSVRYAVHVASFRETARARELADTLSGQLGVSTGVTPADLATGRWYRVLVGSFHTREEAAVLRRQLEHDGDFAFLRTVAIPFPDSAGARP